MTRKIRYGYAISLDGYMADRDGRFEWAAPAADVHAFWNQEAARSDLFLYGRTLWEMMNEYWATADEDPDATPETLEFAHLWQAQTKVVFSRSLEKLELKEKSGDVSLVRENAIEEVRRLRSLPGGDIDIGGADFASNLIREDLVDEYLMVVYPVIVGGGKSMLPPVEGHLPLDLIETRTFDGGVVALRYARRR